MYKSFEIQSPNHLKLKHRYTTIFLAGSIEMGKAVEWQKDFIAAFPDKPYIFFNPRRDDWDSSWEQKITHPKFREQVEWELEALEVADVIVMYFDPNTMSPISLLELGLHAKEKKLVVICPEGFWRKGNVDIVCQMYNIHQLNSFDELIELFSKENVKQFLRNK